MRYFLEIAYHGKNYCGWQRQPNAISVQEVLEEKLSMLLGQSVSIIGAGRTDAGVHAKQLFAHFEIEPISDVTHLVYRLNSFLPPDISVGDIFPVQKNAHARFDASEREYEYWITIKKNPFLNGLAYEVHRSLDLEAMNEAANILLDYEDFKCFSRSKTDVKTYHCSIKKAVWKQHGDLLIFTIVANRFLRNMVRAIVGTLIAIGEGKLGIQGFKKIIESRDRSQAGASAPAHGLYLTRVTYPDTIQKNNS